MTAPSRPFSPTRSRMLSNPDMAAHYLEAALKAGDDEAFKLALRQLAEARLGGIAALAAATDLNREALYRALSRRGNPTFATLNKVLQAAETGKKDRDPEAATHLAD